MNMKRSASKFLDRKILKDGTQYDMNLIWVVVLMTAFSLIMIYSASIANARYENDNEFFFLIRQVVFVSIGGVGAYIVSKVPMRVWLKLTPWLLIFSYVMLFAVLAVGREINGAKRWIHLGPINIQPTEFFKIAVILYLASFLTRREAILTQLKKVWFVALPIVGGLFLIMKEPDFGSFVIVVMVSVGLLFLGGLPMKWFLVVVGVGAAGMVGLIMMEPYRMARVAAFMDPWDDPLGKGYQLTHSLMAVARGEWFGVGLGASLEKRFYLPEAHTDFILAVISEEFGFVGMMVLMGAYVWIMLRAFSIGKQARDLELYFSAFTAKGIALWLGIQTFFNMGVNLGLLPTKGLTLPLMSYGGSAVIVMLACMAILVRIDYENRRKMQGYPI